MNRHALKIISLLLLFLLPAKSLTAIEQTLVENPLPKTSYLRLISGLARVEAVNCESVDYNLGVRLFAEYKREFGKNWYHGMSFDGMFPLTLHPTPLLKNVSTSVYYHLPLVRESLMLSTGIGLGCNFIFLGNNQTYIRPSMNLNLGIWWRVLPKVYLEFSPFLLLFTRFNFPMPFSPPPHVISYSIPPLGISIKL